MLLKYFWVAGYHMGATKVAKLSRIRINKLLCLNLCMELKYLLIGLPLLIALIFAEAKHNRRELKMPALA